MATGADGFAVFVMRPETGGRLQVAFIQWYAAGNSGIKSTFMGQVFGKQRVEGGEVVVRIVIAVPNAKMEDNTGAVTAGA